MQRPSYIYEGHKGIKYVFFCAETGDVVFEYNGISSMQNLLRVSLPNGNECKIY